LLFLPYKGAAKFFSILQGAVNQKRLKNTGLDCPWWNDYKSLIFKKFEEFILLHRSLIAHLRAMDWLRFSNSVYVAFDCLFMINFYHLITLLSLSSHFNICRPHVWNVYMKKRGSNPAWPCYKVPLLWYKPFWVPWWHGVWLHLGPQWHSLSKEIRFCFSLLSSKLLHLQLLDN